MGVWTLGNNSSVEDNTVAISNKSIGVLKRNTASYCLCGLYFTVIGIDYIFYKC